MRHYQTALLSLATLSTALIAAVPAAVQNILPAVDTAAFHACLAGLRNTLAFAAISNST